MNNIVLKIKDISLEMRNISKPILHNINYQVNTGDCIIILGSNGSGKSSLLKLLDRRYQATSGSITFDGKELSTISDKDYAQKVITLTQNFNESLFSSLTVFENCLMAKQRNTDKNLLLQQSNKKSMRNFFAEYLINFNPNLVTKFDSVSADLSGGEQQTLALALSVLYPPEILLLDEHTSALDPKTAVNLMHLTQKVITTNKITCLLATHSLDIALNYGNKILALKNGAILKQIDKTKENIIDKNTLIEACY